MNLTTDELAFIQQQEALIKEQQAKQQLNEIAIANQQAMLEEREKNVASEQLDISDVIHKIYHLLKGDILIVEDGELVWKEPESYDMKVLSDYGIQLIMNTICFYINKNTLLSNYEEKVILQKMEDFAKTLNATMLMEYEKIFVQPTLEDCKEELLSRIKKKTELRAFTLELLGKTADKKEIEEKFIKEMENRLETELEKIKQTLMKNKLKRFMLILREVQDAVHSTYLRAWKGQERRTLREHIHISETLGGNKYNVVPQKRGSMLNPMNWFRK